MDKAKIGDKKALKNTNNPENWNSKPNSTDRISAIGQPARPTIRLTPVYYSWIKKSYLKMKPLSKKKLPPPPKKRPFFGGG